MPTIKRIGVLTGGGDAPGLNAVIRAVTFAAIREHGWEVMGIEDGYLGLIENRLRPLRVKDVWGILSEGGTILGTSNKANPSNYATGTAPDGKPIFEDVTGRCYENARTNNLDAVVVIGGDGTMAASESMLKLGLPIVGVPKTIDNDIIGTELTFGFLSAVDVATEALDRVRTTAASHARIIAVEVMGRNAGWIALHAGIASSADAILIPEIPFDPAIIAKALQQRRAEGQRALIICVAEGARPVGGQVAISRMDPTSPDPIRLGGISRLVSEELERLTGIESRYVILGHIQRGGPPIATDRVLASRFGHHAIGVLAAGRKGRMVAFTDQGITDIDMMTAVGAQRTIPPDHSLLEVARSSGVSFGD